MIEALIAAGASIIVGIFSLIGVAITNSRSNAKMQNDIRTAQAVTDERISELTREVRKHNNFAERIPVVEGEIKVIGEQIKVSNHRITDLEAFHKPKN